MTVKPVQYHLGKFPPKDMDWSKLIPLIGPANASLASYGSLLRAIPNPHILLSPLITQEAVLSSKIEGTHVTIGEVLEIEAIGKSSNLTQNKRDDAEEVMNYRGAMLACVAEMEQRPFSQHMLRAAHALLMKGVRGRDKSPGSYRKEQNWIGPKGCTVENSSFVPVAPESLPGGMDMWEEYFNSTNEPDILVQLALLHAEFEALHPFKDGNGRLGRMIIPLFLYHRKLLLGPDFYMSGYLEANRDEYQERLRSISRDGAWTAWCVFFLNGIQRQAVENERKAKAILNRYDNLKERIINLTHSQHAVAALDYIFKFPIFSGTQFTNSADIPKPTAGRILKILRDENILVVIRKPSGRIPAVYAFIELLSITEST